MWKGFEMSGSESLLDSSLLLTCCNSHDNHVSGPVSFCSMINLKVLIVGDFTMVMARLASLLLENATAWLELACDFQPMSGCGLGLGAQKPTCFLRNGKNKRKVRLQVGKMEKVESLSNLLALSVVP